MRKKRLDSPNEAKIIDKAIADIEAATNSPKLVTLNDFIANASKSDPTKKNSNH